MKIYYLLPLLFLINACATIFTGTSQNISIEAVDSKTNKVLSSAVCSVRDGSGALYTVQSNPGSITIKKGQGVLTPTCNSDGYKQLSYAVGDSFNAVTFVNVLFWPGFIVDGLSGSMNKYPSHIVVAMESI